MTMPQVWQYVAGDRPALSRQEFYTAMKLVSLAQLNGGVLDDQQALRLVNGLAGPVPLPRMQGIGIPRGIELPHALLPHAAPTPEAPAPARAAPAAPSPARAGSAPGAVPPAAPPPPGTAFPPLSAEQAAAFQTAFSQLDTDRDGFVQVGGAQAVQGRHGNFRAPVTPGLLSLVVLVWLPCLRPFVCS